MSRTSDSLSLLSWAGPATLAQSGTGRQPHWARRVPAAEATADALGLWVAGVRAFQAVPGAAVAHATTCPVCEPRVGRRQRPPPWSPAPWTAMPPQVPRVQCQQRARSIECTPGSLDFHSRVGPGESWATSPGHPWRLSVSAWRCACGCDSGESAGVQGVRARSTAERRGPPCVGAGARVGDHGVEPRASARAGESPPVAPSFPPDFLVSRSSWAACSSVLLSCRLAAAGGPRGQETPLRSLPRSVAGEDGTLERDSAARGRDDTRRGRPVALSCLLSSRPQAVGRRARPRLAGYLGSLPSIHWPLLEDSRTCGGRGPVRPRPWPELRSPPCSL